MNDAFADVALILREIRLQRAEMHLLRDDVRRLLKRDCRDVARLSAFLVAVHAFDPCGVWTANEILQEARRARRVDLLTALDAIIGDGGDAAKRLGCWLRRHDGATWMGYALIASSVRRAGHGCMRFQWFRTRNSRRGAGATAGRWSNFNRPKGSRPCRTRTARTRSTARRNTISA